MTIQPFAPAEGGTITVANSASATAATPLPLDCDVVVLSNSSSTATVFVRVTYYDEQSDTMTGAAPTVTTDLPILPLNQIRRRVAPGRFKVIRTIASAADGNLYITPGTGN
jgi:hypothetical protein